MKPRNREVNIFNMSVLDLLTGALGAFCFLTLALFPSYYKTHRGSAATGKTVKKETAKPKPQVRGLEGPVPPFGFLSLGAYPSDRPEACAGLEVTGSSSESGGALSLFPRGVIAPGKYARFLLFAFQPGAYHLTVRVKPIRMPCDVNLDLRNPNNDWTKSASVSDPGQPIEFDFSISFRPI
jgi:hypothetical protein